MGLCEYCMMINPFLKGAYKRPGFSESMVVDLDKQQLGLSVSFASKADLTPMPRSALDAELGQESQASSCLRKGTPLASRVAQRASGPSSSTDCSSPGSSIHGILQARILEWVAISFSNA